MRVECVTVCGPRVDLGSSEAAATEDTRGVLGSHAEAIAGALPSCSPRSDLRPTPQTLPAMSCNPNPLAEQLPTGA